MSQPYPPSEVSNKTETCSTCKWFKPDPMPDYPHMPQGWCTNMTATLGHHAIGILNQDADITNQKRTKLMSNMRERAREFFRSCDSSLFEVIDGESEMDYHVRIASATRRTAELKAMLAEAVQELRDVDKALESWSEGYETIPQTMRDVRAKLKEIDAARAYKAKTEKQEERMSETPFGEPLPDMTEAELDTAVEVMREEGEKMLERTTQMDDKLTGPFLVTVAWRTMDDKLTSLFLVTVTEDEYNNLSPFTQGILSATRGWMCPYIGRKNKKMAAWRKGLEFGKDVLIDMFGNYIPDSRT